MGYQIRKTTQLVGIEYYPVGDKGPQLGGNADQESEVPEEANDEMEAMDMETYTPGKDNLIIDKNETREVDPGTILAELKQLAILANSGYAYDLITATMIRLGKIIGD